MIIENYLIKKIVQKRSYLSTYEGVQKTTSKPILLFEFKKNINLVKTIEDVFYKILIYLKVANPLEIIDIFYEHNKFYIVLPKPYLSINYPFSGLNKNSELSNFLLNQEKKVKYLYIYGKDFLRKSFLVSAIRVFLTIKNFKIFYFKPPSEDHAEDLFLKKFLSFFDFDISNRKLINNLESKVYLEQNFLKIAYLIEQKLNKRDIALIIDDIDYFPDNMKEFIFSLGNFFLYTKPKKNLITILGSNSNQIHPLIKKLNRKEIFLYKAPYSTIEKIKKIFLLEKKNFYEKLLKLVKNVSQFYFLLFYIDNGFIDVEMLYNKKDIYEIFEFIFNSFSEQELEIIKLIYTFNYPVNSDIISYFTNIPIIEVEKFINNLILKMFIFRINTSSGNYYIKFFEIDFVKFNKIINSKLSSTSFLYNKEHDNIRLLQYKLFEKIGDYYLNFSNDIKKSLYFYIRAQNKKKSILLAINLVSLYKEIHLYEKSKNIIELISKNFELELNEKIVLGLEKTKISHNSGNFYQTYKNAKEVLNIIPKNSKKQRYEAYFYLAIGYLHSKYIYKSRNIFKFLIRGCSNFKIIYYAKLYLNEINFLSNNDYTLIEDLDALEQQICSSSNLSKDIKEEILANLYILKIKYYVNKMELEKAMNLLSHDIFSLPSIEIKTKITHKTLYAYLLFLQSKTFESITILSYSIVLIEEIKELKLYSDVLHLMGLIFFLYNNFVSSKIYLSKAFKIKKEINDEYNLAVLNIAYAQILFREKKYSEAKEKIIFSIEFLKKLNINEFNKAVSVYNYIIYNQNSTHLGVR